MITGVDNTAHTLGSESWKNFKFINHASTEKKVVDICKLLGELGNFELLVDTILKLIEDTPHYQKELMLLLNWILDGTYNFF